MNPLSVSPVSPGTRLGDVGNHTFFLCGLAGFMDHVKDLLDIAGHRPATDSPGALRRQNVKRDRRGAAPSGSVEFAKSSKRATVFAVQSLLEVAEANGSNPIQLPARSVWNLRGAAARGRDSNGSRGWPRSCFESAGICAYLRRAGGRRGPVGCLIASIQAGARCHADLKLASDQQFTMSPP